MFKMLSSNFIFFIKKKYSFRHIDALQDQIKAFIAISV